MYVFRKITLAALFMKEGLSWGESEGRDMVFPVNLPPTFLGQLLKFKYNILIIKCINLKCRGSEL